MTKEHGRYASVADMLDDMGENEMADELRKHADCHAEIAKQAKALLDANALVANLTQNLERHRKLVKKLTRKYEAEHKVVLGLLEVRDELKERILEFETLHSLQHKRMMQARAKWQAHTGKELTFPDLGDLIEWLCDRIDTITDGAEAVGITFDNDGNVVYRTINCQVWMQSEINRLESYNTELAEVSMNNGGYIFNLENLLHRALPVCLLAEEHCSDMHEGALAEALRTDIENVLCEEEPITGE
jgi:hypothetical protein